MLLAAVTSLSYLPQLQKAMLLNSTSVSVAENADGTLDRSMPSGRL
jgi:hypothetical protein